MWVDSPQGSFAKASFENFRKELQPEALKKARAVAMGELKGLLLIGPVGIGKTHLAAAIYNCWKKVGETKVFFTEGADGEVDFHPGARFINEVDLMARIRQTYQDHSEMNEAQVLNLYKSTGFLILDDLCKYSPQDVSFRNRIYFDLLDWRWMREKPLIATSNNSLEQLDDMLGPPIVDRLRDMCEVVVMKGQSQRGKG